MEALSLTESSPGLHLAGDPMTCFGCGKEINVYDKLTCARCNKAIFCKEGCYKEDHPCDPHPLWKSMVTVKGAHYYKLKGLLHTPTETQELNENIERSNVLGLNRRDRNAQYEQWEKEIDAESEIKQIVYTIRQKLCEPNINTVQECIDLMQQHFNKFIRKMDIYKERNIYTKNFAWVYITMELLDQIVKFVGKCKILEVAGGNGLLGSLLLSLGCHITITDLFTGDYINISTSYEDKCRRFSPYIEEISGPNAVMKYRDANVLLLCWPPLDSMAYNCLKLFRGNKVVFIGEYDGRDVSLNGDDKFFSLLKKEWNVEKIIITNWYGIHDELFLYSRKELS
jgi:hypothetical protein